MLWFVGISVSASIISLAFDRPFASEADAEGEADEYLHRLLFMSLSRIHGPLAIYMEPSPIRVAINLSWLSVDGWNLFK